MSSVGDAAAAPGMVALAAEELGAAGRAGADSDVPGGGSHGLRTRLR